MNNSVLRGIDILELLERADRPMGLAEVSRETGIPKSTALGILRALAGRRFVEVEELEDRARYRLGLRAFEVGAAYLRGVTPSAAAHPELARLVEELGATAHFAILDGPDVVYLEKEDPAHANVRLASAVGTRLAAHHTSVGQAQLALLPEEDVVRAVGTGPFPYLDGRASWTFGEFKDRLAKVRERRFAVDDEETLENVQCVAAAVIDAGGRCRGAVGVSFLRTSNGLRVEEVAAPVMAAAGRASERLGRSAEPGAVPGAVPGAGRG